MCLLVVLSGIFDRYPLVVAANRDERYDRPTEPLARLRDSPLTLGGRDLRAGGTWLAVNEHGVVAGLTNEPRLEGRDDSKASRGEIPLRLTQDRTAGEGARTFASSVRADRYNGCWALVGDRDSLFVVDCTGSGPVEARELAPGLHVVENSAPDAPSAKAERVRSLLGDIERRSEDAVLRSLRAVLRDHRVNLAVEDAGGDQPERRSEVSACCVHTDGYGTRSAMTVRVPADRTAAPEMWTCDGPSCTHRMRRAQW